MSALVRKIRQELGLSRRVDVLGQLDEIFADLGIFTYLEWQELPALSSETLNLRLDDFLGKLEKMFKSPGYSERLKSYGSEKQHILLLRLATAYARLQNAIIGKRGEVPLWMTTMHSRLVDKYNELWYQQDNLVGMGISDSTR